jgi:DNA-binding Xre family transcriptional regulator
MLWRREGARKNFLIGIAEAQKNLKTGKVEKVRKDNFLERICSYIGIRLRAGIPPGP